tara:strand:+ start:571 stop:1518 length:948 start_codon:yes stop_codon:yes gene_type:complete
MKRKTFLVTGGTGFIGSNISKLLIKKNYQVKIFDNNYRGSIGKIEKIKKKVKFIKGDIRNKNLLNKSLKNTDAVIHLAYINGTKKFYKEPVKILDIAVKGILNVLEGCIKNNIKELYLASSSEVYQTPNKIPTNEKEPLKIPDIYNPRFSYGGGKILTELMGVNYGKKFFKKLVIFRPHNVYGPDMGYDHVIPEFIKKIKKVGKNKKFKIKGNGNETRSFIFIDDFVNAFDLILKKGRHLNIYNIGTSEQVKISRLAFIIAKFYNKKIVLKKTKLAQGSALNRCPDIKKISKLGFKKKYNLNMGLSKTINWHLNR